MNLTKTELEEKEAELLLRNSWDMSWNPQFGLYNPALSFRSGYIPTREIEEMDRAAELALEGAGGEE